MRSVATSRGKKALILTLGSRDVRLPDNFRETALKKNHTHKTSQMYKPGINTVLARPAGRFLLDHYQEPEYFAHLDFPIADAVYRYVSAQSPKIDRVFLVVTDQPDHVEDRFRLQDSVHYGELIQQVWTERYGAEGTGSLPDIRILRVSQDIHVLDRMYTFWDTQLQQNRSLSALSRFNRIWLCPQGGVDALNTGLLLAALHHWGPLVEVLNVPENIQTCIPIQFGRLYLEQRTREQMAFLLRHYNYAAIAALEVPEPVQQLAAYGLARQHFDFETCIQTLARIPDLPISFRDSHLIACQRLQKQEETDLLRELWYNAQLLHAQEQYVDFLTRFYRLLEGYLKYRLGNALQKPIEQREDWGQALAQFRNRHAKKYQELEQHFRQAKLPGPLHEGQQPQLSVFGVPTLLLAFRYFYGGDEAETARLLQELYGLAQLRHQSIGAHAFQPVTLQMIEHRLNASDMLLEQLFEFWNQLLDVQANPYLELNAQMLQLVNP